jgi:hypothetical protein
MPSPSRPAATSNTAKTASALTKPLFVSPAPAGRRITAGFSYLQRIGKSASIDVWFPDAVHEIARKILAAGETLTPSSFPAEWAAVRQFELLREAGNVSIYDLEPEHLMRTIRDLTRHMHGGGHRVTVVTIGSYADPGVTDELEILDRRLQDRIAALINMLYLEEQSEKVNASLDEMLRVKKWDYRTALPHIGVALGARDLFRPRPVSATAMTVRDEIGLISSSPHRIEVSHGENWIEDLGVRDAATEKPLVRVSANPRQSQYAVTTGIYQFAPADAWKEVLISYRYETAVVGRTNLSEADRKHQLARHFFEILDLLPHKHILHDTAIGLQLPEQNSENQWIYIAREGEKIGDFVRLMDNLFAPFNKISLSELHGRAEAGPEIKPMVGHMRGYGDRLNAEADSFYRNLARHAM